MDNPVIDEPREAPPWSRTQANPKITPKQREYILGLVEEREHGLPEGKLDQLMKMLRISEDREEFGMGKAQASQVISWLKAKPKKTTRQPGLPDVPAGRYAVEANDGELRFYKVWVGRNGYTKLYVLHGPDESQMNYKTSVAIMQKILNAGVRQCAVRYGMEIGSCSNCGRRLTNRISRELGIGPICGGRMFTDAGWKDEVKAKRAEISARGEDPDEELS